MFQSYGVLLQLIILFSFKDINTFFWSIHKYHKEVCCIVYYILKVVYYKSLDLKKLCYISYNSFEIMNSFEF